MSDLFETGDGETPIGPDEREGLRPSWIATRGELNEAEQRNILSGQAWAFARRRDVLTETFLRELHRRMLGEVWSWAGEWRRRETTIGADPLQIQVQMHQLLGDTRYWLDTGTYEIDEAVLRFHHRMVWIHPWFNGNGRHGRLAADVLAISMDRPRFGWGIGVGDPAEARRLYLEALRTADRELDFAPLLSFARS